MTVVDVRSRPFPGAEPEPRPDPAEVAGHALAALRRSFSDPLPCPPECSVCNSAWRYEDHAIGDCCGCGEPCRSWDPAGRPRHEMCPPPNVKIEQADEGDA